MINIEKLVVKLKEYRWIITWDGNGYFTAERYGYSLRIIRSFDSDYYIAQIGFIPWWAKLFRFVQWVTFAVSPDWELIRNHIKSLFQNLDRQEEKKECQDNRNSTNS